MPTPTYTLISETVLGSAQASVEFSSISSSYKDLVLEIITNSTSNLDGALRLNNDTGSNYSTTYLGGNGSSASSGRFTSQTQAFLDVVGTGTSSALNTYYVHIFSYANTNMNKTIISRHGNASTGADALVSLWRSTSAVTSVLFRINDGSNINSGSTFRLWGVVG